jgi:hypothetical protein
MSFASRSVLNRLLILCENRRLSVRLSTIISSNSPSLTASVAPLQKTFLFDTQSVRFAGHSKWQNIRHTKAANDAKKARTFAKFSLSIMKAVVSGKVSILIATFVLKPSTHL